MKGVFTLTFPITRKCVSTIITTTNTNPFGLPVPPNAPHDQVVQELDKILEISTMIDSRLENIDHDLIDVSPPASPEQLLHIFLDPPEYLEINDIMSDVESVDTPFVSPFLDSDDDELFTIYGTCLHENGTFTYDHATAVSPTVDSPGYVLKSDSEEDRVDYPADGGNDGDDEDESFYDDEDDDDVDIEEDEDEDEEEEEHPTPADFTAVALPVVDHAPSAEGTESFKTDESVTTPPPHPTYRVTARMSIRPQPPISFPSDIEISRLMALLTPPPSPLSPWSSTLPHKPSPPLLLPLPLPISPTYPDTTTLTHTTVYSPPLLPPSTDPRVDVHEGEPSTDETELGQSVTDLVATMRRDIDKIYTSTTYLGASTAFKDHGVAGGRPQEIGIVHKGTKIADETSDPDDRKMAPKRTTRANPATTTNTTTTTVIDAQLKALIEQGVNVTLAARDVDRNTNGNDSHVSRTGMEGVVELTQWFEKMEIVFRISNCSLENQIKFSTCSLLGSALTMSPEESDKIERYVGGLPDMIHGSVVASKPKTMQEAIEIDTKLMDKKIRTFTERQTETKRKQGDNQQQQQQNKRQNTRKAYTA
uniref:Reverse transcriptase domain-containing protein n=1 Tax=Tanacetum cinerariifolium TaxID=118510 RepID=A0A6L2KDE2_TANCI|nr:hypothetical protein [Tanacetum cinerariifolium]